MMHLIHTKKTIETALLLLGILAIALSMFPTDASAWYLSGSCTGLPTTVTVGQPVTWSATQTSTMLPTEGHYEWVWSGTDGLSGSTQSLTKTYTTAGTKTANVRIRMVVDSGPYAGLVEYIDRSCSVNVVAPVADFKLVLSDISCEVGSNIRVHFIVNQLPSSVSNYGSVSYVLNGVTRTASFVSASASTAHYAEVISGLTGPYVVSSGYVIINGARANLENPQTVSLSCPLPPALVVSCAAAPTTANTGAPITWSSTASGGTGTYAYSWTGTDGLSGTAQNVTKTYSTAGTKTGTVTVVSGSQTKTASCSATVTEPPPPELTGSCAASPSSVYTGGTVSFTANPSGGTGTYTYSWTGTDGLLGTSKTVSKTYSTTGTKTGTVVITSGTQSITRSCSATVTTPPPTPECKMRIVKAVDKTNAAIGDTLEYTITVENIGTADCTGGGVRIQDVVPQYVTYLSETHSSDVDPGYNGIPLYTSSTRTLIWDGNILVPGESQWVKWRGRIEAPATCGNFIIKNTAHVTSYEYDNFTRWEQSNEVSTSVAYSCVPTLTGFCDASPLTAEVGDPISWTSSASGGTGTYAYSWTGTDGLSGTTQNLSKTYASAGTKTGTVTITSGSQTITRSCETVITTPPPQLIGSCVATPSSVYVGGTVTYEATASGGTGTYGYFWTGTDGLSGITDSVSKTYTSTGTKTGTVSITSGSQNVTATCSATVTNPPPSPAYLKVIKTVINDHGKTMTATDFDLFVMDGTAHVTGSPFVGSATGVTFTLPVGTYRVGETDPASLGYEKKANTGDCDNLGFVTLVAGQTKECVITNDDIFSPPPTLDISCAATPTSAQTGGSIAWSSSVVGGTGTYTYNWTGTDSLSSASSNVSKTYSTAGTKTATVTVTSGTQTKTATCEAVITEPVCTTNCGGGGGNQLIASCAANPSSASIGQNVSYTSTVSGGNGTYAYNWTGTETLTGSAQNADKSYISAGSKTASVTVTSGSESVTATCGTTIMPPPGCTNCGGGGFDPPKVVLLSKPTVGKVLGAVYLSQVPYTGFAENWRVIAFIIVLILWSGAIALFFRKGVRAGLQSLFSRNAPSRIPPLPATAAYTPEHRDNDWDGYFEAQGQEFIEQENGRTALENATTMYKDMFEVEGETDIPANLPTDDAPVSVPAGSPVIDVLAAEAHKQRAVISDDGLRLVAEKSGNDAAKSLTLLAEVIKKAEGMFTREDGWLLLNREKVSAIFNPAPMLNPVQKRPQAPMPSVRPEMSPRVSPQPRNDIPAQNGNSEEALFVNWLAWGDKEKVFSHLRRVKETQGRTDAFMKRVVFGLDSVYRSRLEDLDEPVNEKMMHAVAGLSNEELERLISTLIVAIDQSYKSQATGLKLALLKVMDIKRGL